MIHHPLCVRSLSKRIKDTRLAFLQLISARRLCGSERNRVTVVFDGPAGDLPLSVRSRPNVTLMFSGSASADELIRRIVEGAPSPADVTVVSDDKEVRFFAAACGVHVLGAGEFLGRALKADKGVPDEKPDLSPEEAQRINNELKRLWLR